MGYATACRHWYLEANFDITKFNIIVFVSWSFVSIHKHYVKEFHKDNIQSILHV